MARAQGAEGIGPVTQPAKLAAAIAEGVRAGDGRRGLRDRRARAARLRRRHQRRAPPQARDCLPCPPPRRERAARTHRAGWGGRLVAVASARRGGRADMETAADRHHATEHFRLGGGMASPPSTVPGSRGRTCGVAGAARGHLGPGLRLAVHGHLLGADPQPAAGIHGHRAGASMVTVGIIEGVAEATAAITKVFSGALSDWLGKRKPLMVLGYGLAAFSQADLPAGHLGRLGLHGALRRSRRQGHPRARRATRWWPTSRQPRCAVPPMACARRSIRWARCSARCWHVALMISF